MKHIRYYSILLAAALAATLSACFDTPVASRDSDGHPLPPVNTAPFDRDLPEDSYLSTVFQRGDTVYFVGGRGQTGEAVDSVWAFDLARKAWLATTRMPTARYYAGVAEMGGMLYVIGGRDQTASAVESDRLQRVVERFDPATNTWTQLPSVAASTFDATFPTFVTSARGRLYAVSTRRTSLKYVLHESTDGVTWSAHELNIAAGVEPTLMSDGDMLYLLAAQQNTLGQSFYSINPTSKRVRSSAPAYSYHRGYANRWTLCNGEIFNLNGFDLDDDVLAIFTTWDESWAFNGVPYDITTNRHFAPIVTDRASGDMYFCAPPQIRIGIHYSSQANRFFTK